MKTLRIVMIAWIAIATLWSVSAMPRIRVYKISDSSHVGDVKIGTALDSMLHAGDFDVLNNGDIVVFASLTSTWKETLLVYDGTTFHEKGRVNVSFLNVVSGDGTGVNGCLSINKTNDTVYLLTRDGVAEVHVNWATYTVASHTVMAIPNMTIHRQRTDGSIITIATKRVPRIRWTPSGIVISYVPDTNDQTTLAWQRESAPRDHVTYVLFGTGGASLTPIAISLDGTTDRRNSVLCNSFVNNTVMDNVAWYNGSQFVDGMLQQSDINSHLPAGVDGTLTPLPYYGTADYDYATQRVITTYAHGGYYYGGFGPYNVGTGPDARIAVIGTFNNVTLANMKAFHVTSNDRDNNDSVDTCNPNDLLVVHIHGDYFYIYSYGIVPKQSKSIAMTHDALFNKQHYLSTSASGAVTHKLSNPNGEFYQQNNVPDIYHSLASSDDNSLDILDDGTLMFTQMRNGSTEQYVMYSHDNGVTWETE